MITRRCSERRHFLRPSVETNALFQYLLAVAVERHGVVLHGYTVLSNHFHAELTDPHGELPAFDQYLNSLVARTMNSRLRRRESFWAPGSYNAVTLVTPEDALDKLAYIQANPVSAGLVSSASEWPGLWTPLDQIGAEAITVHRPAGFFRIEGPMPETAKLALVVPPGFDSLEEFRSRLSVAIARREAEARDRLEREGRPFMGVKKILAQDPFDSPAKAEPRKTLRPRIACLDAEKRKEAIASLKRFLNAYRIAWLAFARGLRDTVFPHGTYWMRVAYGVGCDPPD